MAALPRPALPPGPHRDLVEALHDLHHRAGWPSLRILASAAGCSHTTVSKAFSTPQLPSWGLVEILTETMGGEPEELRPLWVAAGSPPGQETSPPRVPIAGRRRELEVVRRHLESGSGLLVVVGEAGIGKTTLVRSAVAGCDTFVAVGACLPLSTEVPLLPVAEALRTIHDHDGGRWLAAALANCPAYVPGALQRLLPDLPGARGEGTGSGSLLHLYGAVAAVLAALSERAELALLLEDLHWADDATLDLLEHLASRPRPPRLVGTWRSLDLDTGAAREGWLARARRTAGHRSVELSPLTLQETAEQLRLAAGTAPTPERLARIHAQSAGHPLFTEHLATQAQGADLPRGLADLLDRRLGVLSGAAWVTARTLGLADRGLADDPLRRATGLDAETLTAALHALQTRRLVAAHGAEVRLSHPLLAEAVRRRVMPGEAAEAHRRLAEALALAPDVSAGEVAVHWQAAGDRAQELAWRVAAAREAGQRLGPAQEATQWLRALDLWSPDGGPQGTPPVSRAQAAFHAMDALWFGGKAEQVDALAASMLPDLADLPPKEAAELLAITGRTEAIFRSLETGLSHTRRAVAILESLGPSTDLVQCLRQEAGTLVDLGRHAEAAAVRDRAWEVNRALGDVEQERLLMAERAWHLFETGRRAEARRTVEEAIRTRPRVADPFVEVTLAKQHADLLTECRASTDDIVAASRRGLALAAEAAVDTVNVGWLRYDLATALTRSGDVAGAGELIDPLTDDQAGFAHHPLELVHAELDLCRGRLDLARSRSEQALLRHASSLDVRSRWCALLADVELWEGRPAAALDRTTTLLGELVDLEEVAYAAPYFLLAARASADLVGAGPAGQAGGRPLAEQLGGVRARAVRDPLAADQPHSVTWDAELARLDGCATVDHWTRAAAVWAGLGRRHDAAYCRWRGAQVALGSGHRTVAQRLLKRAVTEAVHHVPLAAAISVTAGYAQRS